MRRSGAIDRATLDAARRALALLADRADGMTKKQAIQALSKEIRAARDNRCGFDEIADELTKNGIAIGSSTLKGYWSEESAAGSDSAEMPAERRPRQRRSARARRARSPIADEAGVLGRQAAVGLSPIASQTEGVGGRDDRLAVEPSADVSTGEVQEPAGVADEPVDGGAPDTFQPASGVERTEVEPQADAALGTSRGPGSLAERPATGRTPARPPPAGVGESPSADEASTLARQVAEGPSPSVSQAAGVSTGEVRALAVAVEEPADGGAPAAFRPAGVGDRTGVEPSETSPPKFRKAPSVAERPAKGRAAATPPPVGVGESASRSPVDETRDAPPANGDDLPTVDTRGAYAVKINRGDI